MDNLMTYCGTLGKNLLKNANLITAFGSEHRTTIMTLLGCAGVTASAIMVGMDTPKAIDILNEKSAEKEDELTIVEEVKAVAPIYWKEAVLHSASIFLIIKAHSDDKKDIAALMSAYSIAQNALKDREAKTIELFGDKKNEKIRDEINKDKISKADFDNIPIVKTGHGDDLFIESLTGVAFYSDIEYIRQAANDFRESVNGSMEGFSDVNEWLTSLGLRPTQLGQNIGWHGVPGKTLDIHFTTTRNPDNESQIITYLDYYNPPHFEWQQEF